MKNGGLITKTINTPTTSSASGVWSLQEQYEAETNNAWPKYILHPYQTLSHLTCLIYLQHQAIQYLVL